MNGRALVWGLIWIAAGAVVALGWLPGSGAWPTGPRVGVAAFLLMLGVTVVLVGNASWVLRRTTRPEDYDGRCPVGVRCGCGVFNMKPRDRCRSCGLELAEAAPAGP